MVLVTCKKGKELGSNDQVLGHAKWSCVVLRGAAWCCVVLRGAA